MNILIRFSHLGAPAVHEAEDGREVVEVLAMHVEVEVANSSLGEDVSEEGTACSKDNPVGPDHLVVLSEQGDIMEVSRDKKGSVVTQQYIGSVLPLPGELVSALVHGRQGTGQLAQL